MLKRPIINLVGIPYDLKSSYMRGAAAAPSDIRNTISDGSSNDWTETGFDYTTDAEFKDLGDLQIQEYEDLFSQLAAVYHPDESFLFLGGDHSITYPIVKTIHQHKQGFDILHFDAHTDLYHDYEGDPYSHACPFARIMEEGLCERLIQVGIRTVTKHQREQIEKFGVEVITMRDLDRIHQLELVRPLYISIDLDGFDPAYAPGVSHHEPGGLVPRDVINFLIGLQQEIIAADIVELNPRRDHERMTSALASKLLKELCGIMIRNHRSI